MAEQIPLTQIMPISDPEAYKLHLACWNGHHHPLDVFARSRAEWASWNSHRGAKNRFKGVYLVADKSTGKKYVGSAYNGVGIWARWRTYLETGHGYNDELTKLIDAKGINYARKNFRMSLLEYRPMKTDDKTIIEREGYWKEALLTRGAFGYNKN